MKPKKYLTAFLMWSALEAVASFACFGRSYGRWVLLVIAFVSCAFASILASLFKDGVMREMGRLDPEGYRRTVDKTGWQKASAIHIDKTYAYYPEIQVLLDWWRKFNWLVLCMMGVPFVLSIFS